MRKEKERKANENYESMEKEELAD